MLQLATVVAGCSNQPTPDGTLLAAPDTDAVVPAAARSRLVQSKTHRETVSTCFAGRRGPAPAELDVSFTLLDDPHGSDVYLRDARVVVKRARGWTLNDVQVQPARMVEPPGAVRQLEVTVSFACENQATAFTRAITRGEVTMRASGAVDAH